MTDRRLVTIGVLLGVFLAGIEGTVVSVAMPTVVKSVGGLGLYSWVFAAYMLAASVSMPIFGKLADAYGRRRLFNVGVAAFVAGSVLAGTATTMPELIAYRVLQGVGGGAMFSLPYTILGVVYPPDRRGKAIGLGSAVWGISSVIGPPLGFVIIATLGWRWVFYLSVPVGIAAVVLVTVALEESTGDAAPSVDLAGSLALAVAVGALLVGLQFLEGDRPLALTGGLLGVSAIGFVGLIAVERRAPEPILPPALFRDRTFLTTNAVAFLTSFSVFAAVAYVPLFVQSARGGAGSAALAIFPLSIGWSGTSILVGRVIDDLDARRVVLAGTALMVASFVAAAGWTVATPLAWVLVTVFAMGVSMGAVTIPLLTTIQNRFGTAQMGVATSSQQFFRNLGGTMGVAILGVGMTAAMRSSLRDVEGVTGLQDLQRLLLGGTAPSADLLPILLGGLRIAFVAAAVICVVAVTVAVFMPMSPGSAAADGD